VAGHKKTRIKRVILFGAPGEIRTPDRLVRSQVLYPAELRALISVILCTLLRGRIILAEREGFEPSMKYNPHTPLAGERLQPLGHLSTENANTNIEI
jgi:hypothetical protein